MSEYRYGERPGYRERGYGRRERWEDERDYGDESPRLRDNELRMRNEPGEGLYGREGDFETFGRAPRRAYGRRESWRDMGPSRSRPGYEEDWEQTEYNRLRGDDIAGRYGERRSRMLGGYAGRGPRGYQRSNDRVREDVCELLTRHPDIDASEIEVKVESGVVTLRGQVEDRYQKRLAEDLAEDASGVQDVRNELEVDKSLFEELKDAVTGRDREQKSNRRSSSRSTASSRR